MSVYRYPSAELRGRIWYCNDQCPLSCAHSSSLIHLSVSCGDKIPASASGDEAFNRPRCGALWSSVMWSWRQTRHQQHEAAAAANSQQRDTRSIIQTQDPVLFWFFWSTAHCTFLHQICIVSNYQQTWREKPHRFIWNLAPSKSPLPMNNLKVVEKSIFKIPNISVVRWELPHICSKEFCGIHVLQFSMRVVKRFACHRQAINDAWFDGFSADVIKCVILKIWRFWKKSAASPVYSLVEEYYSISRNPSTSVLCRLQCTATTRINGLSTPWCSPSMTTSIHRSLKYDHFNEGRRRHLVVTCFVVLKAHNDLWCRLIRGISFLLADNVRFVLLQVSFRS